MLKNYFNVAFRNLIKHKFYSLINILGLSIGLTSFLMIALFVTDELSYDGFHKDGNQIYRMDFSGNINGSEFITALAGPPTAQVMVSEFPEVEEAVRLRGTGNRIVRKKDGEDSYNEEDVVFADKNFFEFFDYNLIAGDPKTCLERPNTLVLSKEEAEKIFGREDPTGETLILGNNEDWEVTGVFEMPTNSHLNFGMILTMENRDEAKSKMWMSMNFNTYLKLQKGFDSKELEAKFPQLIEKYIGPEVEKFLGSSLEEFYETGNVAGFSLFPMKDIHLKSNKLGDLLPNGDIKYVYIFSAIAAFILILACINFMNLSTARSAGRAKEVGLRKVMGAYRNQLVKQFLSEAFLITFISIAIAYGLSFVTLPSFNDLAEKQIAYHNLFSPSFLFIIIGILVVVGIFAGSYPAFYLSKFRPIETLKGKLNLGLKGGGTLRSVLVILQFSVSIIMIIGTSIVFQQLSYIQNKKLGYSKDHVIMVHDPWLMGDKVDSYKTEVLSHSNILSGTVSSFLPVNTNDNNNAWFPGTNASGEETYVFHQYGVDHDYVKTLSLEMAEGRNFSRDFLSDSSAVVLNEAAVQRLGWSDPIGKNISTYDGFQDSVFVVTYKVIGVVKDFHFTSLKESIEPLVFMLDQSRGFVSFKVFGDDIDETIDFLELKWDEFASGQPFEYSFLDERFNDLYKAEQKLGSIFGVFAFLAIFIACLGLYGLAAFTAEQKTKEIGVRKVLGASISSIITLLSKEFLKLVGIAFIISAPISYYFMNRWLQDFENRTNINIWIFLIAGFLALAIAWVTMSFQSWSAARVNPAKSLKDE